MICVFVLLFVSDLVLKKIDSSTILGASYCCNLFYSPFLVFIYKWKLYFVVDYCRNWHWIWYFFFFLIFVLFFFLFSIF